VVFFLGFVVGWVARPLRPARSPGRPIFSSFGERLGPATPRQRAAVCRGSPGLRRASPWTIVITTWESWSLRGIPAADEKKAGRQKPTLAGPLASLRKELFLHPLVDLRRPRN